MNRPKARLVRGRSYPARALRAREAPRLSPYRALTSLTVLVQSPGSGTASTAAGTQHRRHRATRSSWAPAGKRQRRPGRRRAADRQAAAILTRKPHLRSRNPATPRGRTWRSSAPEGAGPRGNERSGGSAERGILPEAGRCC